MGKSLFSKNLLFQSIYLRMLIFLINLFLLSFVFTGLTLAACRCSSKGCYSDPWQCAEVGFVDPYLNVIETLTCSKPGCSGGDSCYDPSVGGNVMCSACHWGYGKVDTSIAVDCVYYRSSFHGGECFDSCGSIPSPASCDKAGDVPYSCDPTNTEGLIFQAWQDSNEYDPDNPASNRANYLSYTPNITYKSPPSSFCKHWYREQFTGYIDIPAGVKEFRIITDMDHATDERDDTPGPGECCDGGKQVCGDCHWNGVNCGCGYSTKNKCENGNWCCSWTAHEPRCSDGYGDNTGVKLGFSNSGGVLAPAGEILNSQGTEPPGQPSGLTSIIRSDTTGVQHVFSGNFQGGLYPIQAWYTVSEQNDHEYFTLQWRNPAGSWTTVPSSAFMPCLVSNVEPQNADIKGPDESPAAGLSATIASYTRMYNLTSQDSDGNEVVSEWGCADCTMSLSPIDHVEIGSYGSYGGTAGNGDWPDMQVYTGNPNSASGYGTRELRSTFTNINNVQIERNVFIGEQISSLDIVFPNDANGAEGDRNLYVDYVDYVFTDGSIIRVQAEQHEENHSIPSSTYTYIDKGAGEATYDGVNTAFGEAIAWTAAMRLPVPMNFDLGGSAASSCTLRAQPRDSQGALGNMVTLSVNICGAVPHAPTGPVAPTNGERGVDIPVVLDWNAPASWGDTCGPPSSSFRVYGRQRAAGVCLAADPPNTPVGLRNFSEVCNVAGTQSTCNDVLGFFSTMNMEFCWYVEADNGEYISQSPVWWFETEDPLVYQQWMTTLYGDFYAGSVSMEFPNQIDYIAPWTPPHLSYEDNPASPDTTDVSTLSSNDIDISTDNSTAGYYPESHSGFLAKYTNFTQTWPANYRGDPPAGATEISSDCDEIFTSGNLNPDTTYKADASCVNTGISNVSGGNYQLSDDGVVTLYVTGSSDLRFDNEFVSTNADRRVVFITGEDVDVKIDGTLNSGNPTFISTPEIEAAFVINKSLEFERKAGDPDPETNPDISVVVEGPIITKSVLFERNRGLTNSYPSEVIKYNSYYLYKLTSQERGSNDSNYSGLFVIDVDWISEE